jgi:hypothetical protein
MRLENDFAALPTKIRIIEDFDDALPIFQS